MDRALARSERLRLLPLSSLHLLLQGDAPILNHLDVRELHDAVEAQEQALLLLVPGPHDDDEADDGDEDACVTYGTIVNVYDT